LGKVTSIMVSPSSLHQRVDQLREAVGRVLRQAVGGQPIALSELKALHDQREELVSDLNQMLKRLVVWYRDGLWIETESINASWGDPIRASLEARQPEPLWDAWRDTCLQSGLGEVCPIDTASKRSWTLGYRRRLGCGASRRSCGRSSLVAAPRSHRFRSCGSSSSRYRTIKAFSAK